MKLSEQIKTARASLSDLEADRVDLDGLLTAARAAVESLAPRDWSGRAEGEARCVGIERLLTEQRGYISSAAAELERLEGEAVIAGHYQAIGEAADRARAARLEIHAGLDRWLSQAVPLLSELAAQRLEWMKAREDAGRAAALLGVRVYVAGLSDPDPALALYGTLEAQGVDVAALLTAPPGGLWGWHGQQSDSYAPAVSSEGHEAEIGGRLLSLWHGLSSVDVSSLQPGRVGVIGRKLAAGSVRKPGGLSDKSEKD